MKIKDLHGKKPYLYSDMNSDNRDQKKKLVWYCEDCGMKITITHIKTHTLNGHIVNQVSYDPEFKSKKFNRESVP